MKDGISERLLTSQGLKANEMMNKLKRTHKLQQCLRIRKVGAEERKDGTTKCKPTDYSMVGNKSKGHSTQDKSSCRITTPTSTEESLLMSMAVVTKA